MEEARYRDGAERESGAEAVQLTGDHRDAVIEAVRGSMAAERERTRRALVWLGSSFLLILLLALLFFFLAGIVIVKDARSALNASSTLRDEIISRLAGYDTERVDMLAATDALKSRVTDLSAAVSRIEEQRDREAEQTHADLLRFNAWVESTNAVIARRLTELQSRLDETGRPDVRRREASNGM